MNYLHPNDMTPEQRREANASVFDRIARAHDLVASRGEDAAAQRQSAVNARRAAASIREGARR